MVCVVNGQYKREAEWEEEQKHSKCIVCCPKYVDLKLKGSSVTGSLTGDRQIDEIKIRISKIRIRKEKIIFSSTNYVPHWLSFFNC